MFDQKNRIKIDPEANRQSMAPIVFVVVAAVGVALCLGVYFGLFAGRIIFVVVSMMITVQYWRGA